jgi:hypothetical protein
MMALPRRVLAAVTRLVGFDLIRFWPLAVAAVVVESWWALGVESELHLRPTSVVAPIGPLVDGTPVLDGVIRLLTVAATALLVQADHLADDRAFWRTRPITPAALAIAKAVTLGLLFVVVPAVIDAARLMAYGAPASAIAFAAAQIAANAGFLILPCWIVALATRTPSRFLAAAGALLAAGYLLFFAAQWIDLLVQQFRDPLDRSRNWSAIVDALADWQRQDRHGWTGGLLLTALGLGLLVSLYGTRRIVFIAALGVVLLVAPHVWPIGTRLGAAEPANATHIGGRLSFPKGLTLPARRWIVPERSRVQVNGPVTVPGLPAHLSAAVTWDRLRIRAGGQTFEATGDPQHHLGVDAVDVARGVVPARHDAGYPNSLFTVRPADALRLLVPAVSVEGNAVVTLTERRVIGTVPLAPGRTFRGNGFLLEILGVNPSRDGTLALIRIARFPSAGSAFRGQLSLFVSDARRATVVNTAAYWGGYTQPASNAVWMWGTARRWVQRFELQVDDNQQPVGPGPVLLLVESRPAGRLLTTMTAHDVPVRERPD